jgi:hypothetical protein
MLIAFNYKEFLVEIILVVLTLLTEGYMIYQYIFYVVYIIKKKT